MKFEVCLCVCVGGGGGCDVLGVLKNWCGMTIEPRA